MVWVDRRVSLRHCNPGEVIIREGSMADEAFVIQAGLVDIRKGALPPFDQLKPGEIFGEIAIINDTRRTATITAVEPTDCIAIPREVIRHLLAENHDFALTILKLAVARLTDMESRVWSSIAAEPVTGKREP